MCRHGSSDAVSGLRHKFDCISGGDVFKDHAESGKVRYQFTQVSIDKYFFPVEDINIAIRDLAMYQQGEVVLLHSLKDRVKVSQIVDARL